MHPYLTHLLVDIQKGHKQENNAPNQASDDLEDHFKEIDKWISGDGEQTLSYFCGLKKEDFPPYEQFSEEEVQQVCEAFEEMMGSYGVTVAWPENFPWDRRYPLTVNFLDRAITPMNFGMFCIDFCTGNSEGCELGEYCSCLEPFEVEPLSREKLVESYIEYYNDMNVWGMLIVLHDKIVFENYSKGVLMLHLEGINAFEIQAEKACTFFSWRKQSIKDWQISDDEIVVGIDYHAELAVDFSNSMKAGDELKFTGTSTFHFKDGLISYIKDES